MRTLQTLSTSSRVMIVLHLLVFLLLFQCPSIQCHCPAVTFCECPTNTSRVTCDGKYGNTSVNIDFPSLSSLPQVETYVFMNFKEIRSHAFENVSFLPNRSILIHFMNVHTIHENVFTSQTTIPSGSTLSIEIKQTSVKMEKHAFNNIQIHKLQFQDLQYFNNQSLFDSSSFGENLQINELLFNNSGLTGFMNNGPKSVQVRALFLRHCPLFTQLTSNTFPSYLETTHSLEIADTGLEKIDPRSLHAWELELQELLLKNNTHLTNLPNKMIDGVLMSLHTLDFSNNPIQTIDDNYDWFVYSYAKTLLLRQQRLDVFLKSNILDKLVELRTIDFSNSFIINSNHENDDLFQSYIPDMTKLTTMDVSYTNLTENMVIDLLSSLSRTAVDTVKVRLLGHRLSNDSFCSYFNIFRQAPNLLQLDLDEDHPCNCVVDLFYRDETIDIANTYAPMIPKCLYDVERVPCDIQSVVNQLQCPLGRPSGGDSGSNIGLLGNYAFIGLMVGIGVLLILVGIGSAVVYRGRIKRRFTDADMDDPAGNSTENSTSSTATPTPTPTAAAEVEQVVPIDV